MRVLYVPMGDKIWLANLVQQGGAYHGERLQRGNGLGSIFGSLLRTILPVAKTVAKSVGRQALRTGAEVAQDFLQGNNIGASIRKRGKQGTRRLVAQGVQSVLKKQSGGGFGIRPRQPSKGIKRLQKRKKSAVASRKKKKSRKDALGLY